MSVEKMSNHNTFKMPFLLPDKKNECSLLLAVLAAQQK